MAETDKAPESPTPREDEIEDEDAADAVSSAELSPSVMSDI